MPDNLRALRLCVEAAIAREKTQADSLSQAADRWGSHPFADYLQAIAREHRVHAVMFQARLNALLATNGEPTGRE